jgi:RNA polymerase sigma-70 factor (ECF subfamily)
MDNFSDEELLQRYRAAANSSDGAELLNHLFQRHHRRVAAWCYKLTGDVEMSADLAQEVFLKAFRRLDSFRGESRFSTWLYTITRNHCMDELRSRASSPLGNSEEIPEHLQDSSAPETLVLMERRESDELMRKLIAESLDKMETRVITLHYVQEFPLDSVTRLLGLTNQSGAKAYIVSARRKLARALTLWRNREASMRRGSNAGQ